MSMLYKNTWGTPESRIDQQRSDLFRFAVNIPAQLGADSGVNAWDREIAWAVEKFPFPERTREAVAIKYLNQTNFQPGADTGSSPIDVTVRYAFAQRTAEVLERWHWLTSNPVTGGTSLGSVIKTTGMFYWLVPTASGAPEEQTEAESYALLRAYMLEGVWVKGLSPSEADITTGTGLVTLKLNLQIDRYYPIDPTDLREAAALSLNVGLNVGGVGLNAGIAL